MKKTVLLLLSLVLINGVAISAETSVGDRIAAGPFGYDLYKDIHREPKKKDTEAENAAKKSPVETVKQAVSSEITFYGDDTEAEWENESIDYYPDATLKSAVEKYQQGNFSGCLQEMISLTKVDPTNPLVYYYLGMAYTQVGNKDQAVKAYEYVIKLNSEKTITQYALRGRDCLVDGPTCAPASSAAEAETSEELDEFVNAPYGNGFSDEINEEIRQKELDKIQETINQKPNLDREDIERIQNFDNKTEAPAENKVAEVTNEDVLAAIETLKKAGVTVSVNPYQSMPMNDEYSQLNMLLGNNNNNSNSMMSMLPYLMGQANNGQKIDPQIIQSMMMNSMLTDITFTDNDKK
ncbi:MAG: tetratricopeptide repeat protein [Cyanobacteria bacterium SIG32]|nr:tetratricopeptide repeat protein [Cyanobacteria bacterium SIG32]